MKINSVKYLFVQGVKNLWTNRMMGFASFCIMMVSLLLVGLSVLLSMNINLIIGGVENKNEIIIFLEDSVNEEGIEILREGLESIDNVGRVVFYSREEALENQKEQMGSASELFDILGDDNPLPDSYRIRVDDISLMNATVATINLKFGEMIYSIESPTDFVNILSSVRSTVNVIATAVVLALIIVSMVIISNATRTSVFARRNEINIMKYVGANNTFIRVPFFVEGMLTGLLAGGVATLLTWFGYVSLFDMLSEEMTLWNAFGIKEFISFDSIAVKVVLGLLYIGGLSLGRLALL